MTQNINLSRWPRPLKHIDDAETPEQNWEFWKELVCNPDGTINVEQIKLELSDYSMFLRYYAAILDNISGGAISKETTHPSNVIAVFHDWLSDQINDAVTEALEDKLGQT